MNIIKRNQRSHNKKNHIIPPTWKELYHGALYQELLNDYFVNWYNPQNKDITVKIGGLSSEILTEDNYDNWQISILEQYPNKIVPLMKNHATIIADLYSLPFNPDLFSVDHLFLINTFNFSTNPHALLREMDRVMSEDGYLYISLFNPFSLLLKRCLFRLASSNKHIINIDKLYLLRIIDGLKLLNYKILDQQILPKSKKPKWLNKYCGDLIVIVAQKQTSIPNIRLLQKQIIRKRILNSPIYASKV